METLTLEQEAIETLLIYSNDQEINRIRQEAQARADLLNRLNSAGITNDEIQEITQSLPSIDGYILKRQLSENKKFRELRAAGIKAEAELSQGLLSLSFALKAWHNYPRDTRAGNKFENLVYADTWSIDEQALETYLIRRQHKFYIKGEQIAEHKEILAMIRYFESHDMPNNQVKDCKFLNARIESVGASTFKPRWQYFRNH